jgi:hypothetical protein
MGRVVRGASCPWGELSWGELSIGRVVHGASCLWGELFMGRVVLGRVLTGRVVRGASCLGASGPGTPRIYFGWQRLPCSACPVLPVLFWLSSAACPVLAAFSWQSCSVCPFCLSHSVCHVLAVPFWLLLRVDSDGHRKYTIWCYSKFSGLDCLKFSATL